MCIRDRRKEIERLSEKVKDKEEIISMDRKLIRHYEDELGLKAGEYCRLQFLGVERTPVPRWEEHTSELQSQR